MEAGVFRFIHHAHAPAAEFFNNAVVRDGFVDHEWPLANGRALSERPVIIRGTNTETKAVNERGSENRKLELVNRLRSCS